MQALEYQQKRARSLTDKDHPAGDQEVGGEAQRDPQKDYQRTHKGLTKDSRTCIAYVNAYVNAYVIASSEARKQLHCKKH